MCYALLIDTVSIQKYVFASNKLKENLGASFLVKQVYDGFLKDTILQLFPDYNFNSWIEQPENNPTGNFDVGYIGGGNALLFFKEESKLKEFVSIFSTKLLIKTPGLTAVVAYDKFDLKNFKSELNKLFKILIQNKSLNLSVNNLPRHGITSECSSTGLSAETSMQEKYGNTTKTEYLSSVTYSKRDASYLAKKEYKQLVKNEIKGYEITDELDKLGQKNNYTAIVHIDGNSMGERFKSCETLAEIRNLSFSVQEAVKNSFKELVKFIVDNDKIIIDEKLKIKNLPLTPIILGGDDITFVCRGEYGIFFAEKYMELFSNKVASDKKELSSCAGISITKTKYPFYRSYQFAEQLCSTAKTKHRKNSSGSFLDFHITSAGISGSLSEVREKQYKVVQGNLLARPYQISTRTNKIDDFETCKYGAKLLKYGNKKTKSWPNSSLKDLREYLTLGAETLKQFLIQKNYRGYILPTIKNLSANIQNNGFESGITPYFDMIELLEFYPFQITKKLYNQGGE